jgi:hypothetical protein
MKKFLLPIFFLVGMISISQATWFSGSGSDYSQGANSEYYCASTGTITTQAGSSATLPAWSLTNPYGSGKNLVILDVGINVNASPAAAADFFLAFSSAVVPSSTTISTNNGFITSGLIGAPAYSTSTAVGICLIYSTLGNANKPTAFRYLGGTTGASAIGGVVLTDQTNGKVVVPPGVTVSLQSTSAASITSHVLEREDPQ